MSGNVFYKMRLVPAEQGLEIITDVWVSIHETPCFHFCVRNSEQRIIHLFHGKNETDLQYAKRTRMLKRVSKSNSRFAFDSRNKALEHLKFLKKKQLYHMKRDMSFIKKFLSTSDEDLNSTGPIPDTKELVREHFVFD
jgi:hypothetical protein